MPTTMHGFYIEVTHTGLSQSPLYLGDVDAVPPAVPLRAPGAVYVPYLATIQLYYTSAVSLSFERGHIRKYVDAGHLTVVFRVGQEASAGISAVHGWADYNDSGVVQPCAGGVWTKLENDAAGVQTNTTFLPPGITQLYDSATGLLDFSQLRVGDHLSIRIDLIATPSVNNTSISLRIHFLAFGGWYLTKRVQQLGDGAGIDYHVIENFPFYIGSDEVRTSGAQVEVLYSTDTSVVANGFYIERL